jgi:hypothetical protein
MPTATKVSGNWRWLKSPWYRTGGAWHAVIGIFIKSSGAWKRAFGPLTVTVDSTGTFGAGATDATSDPVTATVSEGIPGYSYQWQRVSGSTVPVCQSPTSLQTTWSAHHTGNVTYDAVWKLKATDGIGTVSYSPDVSVELQFGTPP